LSLPVKNDKCKKILKIMISSVLQLRVPGSGLGMVVHAYNPRCSGSRNHQDQGSKSFWEKKYISKTPTTSWVSWHILVVPDKWKTKDCGLRLAWAKSKISYLKNS
jgi:hypothetical protein